jgi:ribosomal protein S18 acetylase RimI-like enzyme
VGVDEQVDVVVRPYESADRARVRHICFETGYMGESADWFWRDAESFADMFSGYYTDREPESAFVVEIGGVVSGYLLGAVDASVTWNPGSVAGRHIVRRGLAFRPGTAGFIWRSMKDGLTDIATRRVKVKDLEVEDARWPAHLHIDLLPVARGHGAGRRLVSTWFDRLRAADVSGCYLQTMAENTGAIAFFGALGFRARGSPHLIPGFRSRNGERLHIQTMVCDLT